MKNFLILIPIILMFLFSCSTTNKMENTIPVTKILVTPKFEKQNEILFFGTVQEKETLKPFLMEAELAQRVNDTLRKVSNIGFPDIGTGNIFKVKVRYKGVEKTLLCTAWHVCEKLPNGTYYKIGADVGIIDPVVLFNDAMSGGLEMDTTFNEGMVTIEGFRFINDTVNFVSISGYAYPMDNSLILEPDSGKNSQYLRGGKSLLMSIPNNVSFEGLSGARPVNNQGKVIGVYSGRNQTIVEDTVRSTANTVRIKRDTTTTIRIAKFR